MATALRGYATYPGITSIENFEFHESSGINPAYGTVRCVAQSGFPAPNGDFLIYYAGSLICRVKYAHVVGVSIDSNSGGQIAVITFQDERWAWAFYTISGNYNIPLHSGLINPEHERTPQQLASMLFSALHVDGYDVSQLPNDARPRCDWDSANAAQELETLCNDLGCRVVCKRSTGLWMIVESGVGQTLPYFPMQAEGIGVNPRPRPDYLRIVTAPVRFQVALDLVPAARDLDLTWKNLAEVSYKPNVATGLPDSECGEFGVDFKMQSTISNERFVLPDGTAKSPREFALADAFRSWRISDNPTNVPWQSVFNPYTTEQENRFFLPAFGDFVSRQQLVVGSDLVQSYTDELDVDHRRPSYVFGQFDGLYIDGGNYPAGTRIDKQAPTSQQDPEEPVNFSIAVDDIDTDLTIISFSRQMKYFYQTTVNDEKTSFGRAHLFLTTAAQVRNPRSWVPYRYEKLLQVGNGTDTTFSRTIVKEDIEPWIIASYDQYGSPTGSYLPVANIDHDNVQTLGGNATFNNQAEVDQMCDYYLNAYARTFRNIQGETRHYIGMYPIDLDGAIMQVSHTGGQGGYDTMASWNTEHKFDIPNYENRLRRNATASNAALAQYMDYRTKRRERLLSSSNTL